MKQKGNGHAEPQPDKQIEDGVLEFRADTLAAPYTPGLRPFIAGGHLYPIVQHGR
jgi:hypothetical protein